MKEPKQVYSLRLRPSDKAVFDKFCKESKTNFSAFAASSMFMAIGDMKELDRVLREDGGLDNDKA